MKNVFAIVGLTILIVTAAFYQGCDWFEDLPEPNKAPDTFFEECPEDSLDAGTHVILKWFGTDSDGDIDHFEYRFDQTQWVETIEDSASFGPLTSGTHIVRVRSYDDEGAVDQTPDTCRILVKEPPPENLPPETEITTCPPDTLETGEDVTIEWSGSDADGDVVGFQVSFDGAAWETIPETVTDTTISGLDPGVYTFAVRAVDDDGEVDETPDSCVFSVREPEFQNRTVLVEAGTFVSCTFCPLIEDAFDQLRQEYTDEEVWFIEYHHQTFIDPFGTAETEARANYYEHFGWPFVYFNGEDRFQVQDPDFEEVKSAIKERIDMRLGYLAPVSIGLEVEHLGTIASLDAFFTLQGPVGDSLMARFVVTEDSIDYENPYTQETETYRFVARRIWEEPLTFSGQNDIIMLHKDLPLDGEQSRLAIAVFVQSDATKDVYQTRVWRPWGLNHP
jgi:hypothetical protein